MIVRKSGGRRPALPIATLTLALAAGGLAGCATDEPELQSWMDQQRREVKPTIEPIAAPKRFDPQPYTAAQIADPFSAQKMAVALRREDRQVNAAVAAELNRRREPLENFPLDGMAMVGSVHKFGRPVALLRVENLLYQVKVGDYIGQNNGRITKIDETQIVVRELVQDAVGEWIERPSTLQLQESAR